MAGGPLTSRLPADVDAAIRTAKARLGSQIGDTTAVFAEVEEAIRTAAATVAADRQAGWPVWPGPVPHRRGRDRVGYDPRDGTFRTEVHEFLSTLMCSAFRTFQGRTALTDMRSAQEFLHPVPTPRRHGLRLARALQITWQ